MPKKVDHVRRRDELAALVVRVVESEGAEAATFRRIAEVGQFSMGVLTHYFRDKDELIASAFAWLARDSFAALDACLAAAAPGRARLAASLSFMVPARGEVTYPGVWLALWSAARHNPALATVHKAYYARWRRTITANLSVARRQGAVTATASTKDLVADLDRARRDDAVIATLNFPAILADLTVDAEVWFNDGKIGTRVAAAAEGRIELEVTSARAKGERLRAEKGVNFPGLELRMPPLTDKDLIDLDAVAEVADLVGFSFVQRPQDIVWLRAELAQRRPDLPPMPLVLKIETPLAVSNLPRLLVQGAGGGPIAVMIARGDLAVELGYARMAEIQEEIMWLCEAAHVPVVWATQVLDGLISDGIPTRAETTDAAMAQRAECVMLNKGPFLPEAIRFLADVLRRMDRHQSKKTARFGRLHSWPAEPMELV